MKIYNFYADPGHGWLKVSRDELVRLNILKKITPYSYSRNDTVYLEEDCDYTTFCNAKEAAGEAFRVKQCHTNKSSRIRNYNSFHLGLGWNWVHGGMVGDKYVESCWK